MTTVEEQATGCAGAHGYKEYAKSQGFNHVEVLDWCSSAGDWQFIVSVDGEYWQVLSQTNNWPQPGFSYCIDDRLWEGTADMVLEDISQAYN